MAKIVESEVVSKRYFESLGFTIRERDFDRIKKGCDFFIECEGCIQSVEAKAKMSSWVQMLKPQVDRLRNGGLLAIVDKGHVEVATIEDIETVEEITLYHISVRKKRVILANY